MATAARYFDLVREMKNAYNHRLRLVESAQQRGIKPTARLFATTVPTVRKCEFFDLEDFSSRGDFLAKVHTYQLYFNLVRPNSHKENQSPWQIIERLAPRSPLQLCLLPPVILDYYLNDSGGYDVPGHPYQFMICGFGSHRQRLLTASENEAFPVGARHTESEQDRTLLLVE
jgi:hypothetical protein